MQLLSKVSIDVPFLSVGMLPELEGIDSDNHGIITHDDGKSGLAWSGGIDDGERAHLATAIGEPNEHE